MVDRLRSLCSFGVPADKVDEVSEMAHRIWAKCSFEDGVKERVWLEFDVPAPNYPTRRAPGCLTIRAIAGRGFEAELVLPGIVAANASGLTGDGLDGFFCAFLPPTFYS